jgi:uncharacterized protein YukE
MEFEERINRLAERHEALTQTIELMVHEWTRKAADYDRRFARTEAALEQLTAAVISREKRLNRIDGV